ncbi:MAG: amidohydrolase family protein [Bryobacterales bacterium]|nr:amidohydrolase family protein [Bryobacterales bacterium]
MLLFPAPILLAAVALTGVDVIDVVAGKSVPTQTVIIDNGRIAALGEAAAVAVPAGAKTVDARGFYLSPGLWDMHVHLRSNPVDRDKALVDENAALLELFPIHGVVGVREMGGDLSDHVLAWREQIRAGKRVGPRILTPGRKLDVAAPAWPGSIAVTSPESARRAVTQMKQLGADFIKVYFNQVEPPVFKAVMDEAHRVGLKVTGHLPPNLSLQTAFELGLDGMEHSTLDTPLEAAHAHFAAEAAARKKADLAMDTLETNRRRLFLHDAKEAERLYPLLAARPLWVTPTLMVQARVRHEIAEKDFSTDPRRRYFFPAIWASWDTKAGMRKPPAAPVLEVLKRAVKRGAELTLQAHKAGVPILAGTDCGVSNNYVMPGWSLHEELEALVKAGLTPADALRTATVNPARWRGEEASEGTVEKGKRADLVLVRSNPLETIASTREVEAVFLGGEYYPRAKLDAMLRVVAERVAAATKQ